MEDQRSSLAVSLGRRSYYLTEIDFRQKGLESNYAEIHLYNLVLPLSL